MRIAYCLLVHKNPDQVSRLIGKIYSPSDYFCINVFRTNETASLARWQNMASKFGENLILASNYGRSYGTTFLANLDAMRVFSEFQYDYFVNLSGQCYPLMPITQIKEHLGSRSVAHIEHFRLPVAYPLDWGPRGGLHRINYRWFRFLGRDIRVPRLSKNLPYNMHPYGGPAWFCLPKRHADYVLDFVSRHPKIVGFYKRSHIADEMFFQTIIMNSPLKDEVMNKDEWYIDWSRSRNGHPPILTKADLPSLLASGKLFARKFDVTVDSEVLDLIDKENAARV